jgi:hypothetical protein
VRAASVFVWVPTILWLDRGAPLAEQRLLGLSTWLLLLFFLRTETPLVRAQTLVVVVFATAVEYTFAGLLGVYVYRLHNVPWFVPPGHGLVYLGALSVGRTAFVRTHLREAMIATAALGGAYAAWGLSPLAPRLDVLGAFWYACLLGFFVFGRSRGLYVGAFLVVTYLEILGTRLGTWAWQPHDPTGIVPIGNPPSGAAGGYGWFDLAATFAGPVLLARWYAVRERFVVRRPVAQPELAE